MKHNPHDLNKQVKDTQSNLIFKAFYNKPKSALMVEKEIGISRSSITRYISAWEAENKIITLYKSRCVISNRSQVKFYTTNSAIINKALILKEINANVSNFDKKDKRIISLLKALRYCKPMSDSLTSLLLKRLNFDKRNE